MHLNVIVYNFNHMWIKCFGMCHHVFPPFFFNKHFKVAYINYKSMDNFGIGLNLLLFIGKFYINAFKHKLKKAHFKILKHEFRQFLRHSLKIY